MMKPYNPKNERVKKDYFRFLKEADRKAPNTIDGVRKAIWRYEDYTGFKDFTTFNKEQAVAFKKHLARTRAERTGVPLARTTMHSTVNALKAFFKWLSCQPGYKSRINVTHIDYLNLSEKEVRAARQPAVKRFATLEQITRAIMLMPADTLIRRRDRAAVAWTTVTGMRDNATASLRLKHVDVARELVDQDPREVRTKFSKRIVTYFFPVGDELKRIVIDWIGELRDELFYGNDDPVFPRTRVSQDDTMSFAADGLEPVCWANTEPIRKIFRRCFADAGMDYYNPHSFRDTLVQLGKQLCRSPEEFEAWSKNLGHEEMLTTFRSYGSIDPHRQGELIKRLGSREGQVDKMDEVYELMKKLAERELKDDSTDNASGGS